MKGTAMDSRFRDIVYGVALMLMIGWLLVAGRSLFVPIVTAVLIVYIITGLARMLGRLPFVGRRMSENACHLIAVALILIAVVEAGALLVANLGTIAARAPMHQQALLNAIQAGAASLGLEREPTWQTLRADVLGDIDLQRVIRSAAASTSSLLGVQLFILLNVAFLLLERKVFVEKIVRLADSPAQAARARFVIEDINARVSRYLAMQTLLSILVGVLSWLIMAWMGLEFAALWAVVIALLNYIPYIGTIIGIAFPVAMAAAQFGDLDTVLLLLAALGFVQFLVGNILAPQVMGTSLNLSPWVILIALTVWSSLWGAAGAVFSVPIAAIMVVVFAEFDRTRPIAVLMSRDGDIARPVEKPPAQGQ